MNYLKKFVSRFVKNIFESKLLTLEIKAWELILVKFKVKKL